MENKFNFTYSAKEQEEIKKIRNKYSPTVDDEDKISTLRRLDRQVESKATMYSLIVGIIGALIMGTGMSLILTDVASSLGAVLAMIAGILIGVAGIILVCLAYPTYNYIIKKERAKVAPEIIRLTDELMK